MTRTSQWIHGWLLLLPAMALLALFTHYPAVATFWHSFFSTPKGSRPVVFVGADNYRQLLDDPIFWQSLSNNFWYAVWTIPVSIVIALLMAVWVNDRIAGRGFLRLAARFWKTGPRRCGATGRRGRSWRNSSASSRTFAATC